MNFWEGIAEFFDKIRWIDIGIAALIMALHSAGQYQMCQRRQCPIAMPIGASTTVAQVSTTQTNRVPASSA